MRAAELVRDLLERSGMSKSALSARAGVSRSSLDEYLKGKRQPSLAQLERLGEAAGLTIDFAWRAPIMKQGEWRERHYGSARPKTLNEKARILELVVAMAWELPNKPRGDLDYPSLRRLAGARKSTVRP